MSGWNPWHGCTKVSPGCQHCYMYRRDESVGRDASIVQKTGSFSLPTRKNRRGEYKLQPDGDHVYTCFTSDFLHPAADEWRIEAWRMIKERSDLSFFFVTKRIERLTVNLPDDWGDGYENVHICCTCENQHTADMRLPVFLALPIQHRIIIHEPMLEEIQIEQYLKDSAHLIEGVVCGGESGEDARVCDYDWILSTLAQCKKYGVPFTFRQTGARLRKDGKIYRIHRKYQMSQARKAGINYDGGR